MAGHLHDLSQLSPTAIDGVLRGLQTWYPAESLQAVLEKLGRPWSALWNQPFVQEQISLITPAPVPGATSDAPTKETSQPSTPSSDTAVAAYRISTSLDRRVDTYLNGFGTASPIGACGGFVAGCAGGFYPTIGTLGRLINALCRSGEIEKVNVVYEAAQHALTATTKVPGEDTNGLWCQI